MAKSDSQIRLRSRTHLEALVFDHLKQTDDSISVQGAKAITAYYLAEMAYQVDPKLEDPKLRMAVLESIHELEARINLIKSLFPDLVPTPLSTQAMEPPRFNPGQPRLQVVPDPDPREARPDKTDSSPTSAVEIDTSDTPWAGLTIISDKEA
ncbi:hypothetical protein GFS31_40490 (plasmid) [Leptolyngbya sp. BL0902]|uniref:hypothetical protein n=1 Tax=Leptolyngbya sp. BL0902 TaxID=1115757 RepID=UPI0018E71580|nr:hypothetical protein [Leptolyngbya sp. BL0902]QQE67336.1 hypothetical protein GFS31_40490 [Leptolyngbya sp. BL0902]